MTYSSKQDNREQTVKDIAAAAKDLLKHFPDAALESNASDLHLQYKVTPDILAEISYQSTTSYSYEFRATNIQISLRCWYVNAPTKVFPRKKDGSFSWDKMYAYIAEYSPKCDEKRNRETDQNAIQTSNSSRVVAALSQAERNLFGAIRPSKHKNDSYEVTFDHLTLAQLKIIAGALGTTVSAPKPEGCQHKNIQFNEPDAEFDPGNLPAWSMQISADCEDCGMTGEFSDHVEVRLADIVWGNQDEDEE